MTNESLENYIDRYNSGNWERPISNFEISPDVDLALVWEKNPTGDVSNEKSERFYFIKNEIQCVAIVFEMNDSDLHWFVKEEFRGKGYLHRSLKHSIFPYIFSDRRKSQRATSDSESNSQYLLRQGFEECTDNGEIAYYLVADNIMEYDKSGLVRVPLTKEELEEIKRSIYKLSSQIMVIKDKLDCAYGDDKGLDKIAYYLKDYGLNLEFFYNNS